ncbi:hypothetical protein [Oceaniradius stylonematis]|uniref:hypothetical protein n=1 Tax=Oceaniradius stylonematis TaxID=2184161 RepID=UPI00273D1B9E|nr:hypothetical protein [Oceaniradius stylonematis]
MRLVLIALIALALPLSTFLAGGNHAQVHAADHVIEHQLSEAPCAQDHAVDSDCAAISSCPVCVLRHHDAGAGFALATPGSVFPRTGPVVGQSPAPDIQPPRPSVAV